ncbi:MAG: HigA family addiction module antidote protein [Candidatus Eremiobacteraeota bacterium]|nr:HigA family addiction module antidote protein [Candidatus Eremiobacteraeota bacterium]
MTQQTFANALGVSRARVNEILNGRRAVTPDTALRLEKVLGMDAQFWLGLQLMRDLYDAKHSEAIKSEVKNLRPLVRA